MKTGQWFVSSEGTRWYFDSGALSLDFAHTGVKEGNPDWERLRTPVDLSEWLSERFDRLDPADADERTLADALTLRAAIYNLTTATSGGGSPSGDDIDTVNLFAATPDLPPALDGGHRRAGAGRIRIGQALSSVARDAVALFTEHGADGRIHQCSAADCALVFYDDSRTANRRWCSMQRCGNRAKVRAHRARTGA